MRQDILAILIVLLGIGILFAYKTKQQKITKPPLWYKIPPSEEPLDLPEPPSKPEKPSKPQNYEDALKIADVNERPILLYFGADWCGPCKQMRKTLADEQVQKIIENRFIFYHVDTDKERELTKRYKISGIPAYLQITARETIIKKGTGYKTIENFLNWLEEEKRVQYCGYFVW